MPYVRTDDRVKLYYEEHGEGAPLVLAYGIGGNADLWDTNRDALAANPNVQARLALDPNAKEEFYAYYRRLTPVGYANALRALLGMDHITDQLSLIRVPTLLIGGDRDPSLEPMKVMHKKVRGSKLVVLSPASHFANRDQPEAWNRAALEFLAKVDARTQRR